ncbi:MAG: hypothetical protein ABIV43_01455 [Candidatus Saccharimonadales bacterium]
MKTSLISRLRSLRKMQHIAIALVLFVAGLPLAELGRAQAATQLQYRSVQLSDSSPSNGSYPAGVGSGLDVAYKFSFKTGASAASSMVIDFCDNDPIIGDTCGAPTGMSVTSVTIDPANTGDLTSTGWTITNSNSPNPVIKLAQGTGSQLSANTQQNFTLLGFTNPSTVNATTKGSFYARIYTFANTAYGDGVSKTYTNAAAAANSGYTDYGGVALSVDYVISITARVQETLTFCVSGSDPNNWTSTGDCGDAAVTSVADTTPGNYGPPNIILGHGSPTAVLEPTIVDYANIWTQLSTNATNGAVINMHSSIPCGGLSADHDVNVPSSGTCAIPAVNSGSNAGPSQIVAGTAAFGVAINAYTPTTQAGPAAIGTLTPTTPYYNAAQYSFTGNVPNTTSTYFGMDTTTSVAFNTTPTNASSYNGGVTSLFGSTVLTAAGPISRVDARYTFAATSSLTTPAGIYVANLSLIATGTF